MRFISALLLIFSFLALSVAAEPFTTTMEEGERDTFTLGGRNYAIEVMIIEDATPATVTFNINGQITPQMAEQESFVLRDTAKMFINNITLNEAGEAGSGDTVTFTLFYCGDALCDGQQTGGKESCLSCTSDCGCQPGYDCRDYNPPACFLTQCGDNWCSSGETCERDSCCKGNRTDLERDRNNCGACGNVCNDKLVCINGLCQTEPPDQCSTNADCDDKNVCTTDICGGRPRVCYHEPIPYCGLSYAPYGGSVQLESRGNDEYTLEFSNRYDVTYMTPYLTNEGGIFKYGDNDKDLVFIEANFSEDMTLEDARRTENMFNIGILDYFILSSINDSTGDVRNATSHIVRYNSIDTSDRILSFDEEGSGTAQFSYDPLDLPNGVVIGKASLRFGNNNYIAYIGNVSYSQNPLAIDMDGDRIINRTEIFVTTKAANILDFGNAEESDGGNFSYNYGNNWQCVTTFCWSNVGDGIVSGTTSDFVFLTKRRTMGHLPVTDQIVTTHIQTQPENTLNITSVEGRHFTLLPPQDRKRTAYGFLFELYPDINLRISYLRRR